MSIKTYQFGKKAGKKVSVTLRKTFEVVKKPELVIRPIQGQMPGSKEEFWFALALEKMELKFIYQYEIYDGRQRAGGQVIDFLVYTTPLPTPVYIQGEYWHRDKDKDQYKIARARMYFKGNAMPPIEVWGKDLQTPEMALATAKRVLNV
jgi:hypothetical protein